MAAPETLTFTENHRSVLNMIYCVHVCARALCVHMVPYDMMYSQQHYIPPAIINSDAQPNVIMYGWLHDLLVRDIMEWLL